MCHIIGLHERWRRVFFLRLFFANTFAHVVLNGRYDAIISPFHWTNIIIQ